MKAQHYTTSFTVDATREHAFNCINNVTEWWTENLEGQSHHLDDEFTVRFGDVHVSTQKITEWQPGTKVVWLITDSRLNFVSNKQEWNGTSISFDIAEKDGKTTVRFTHHGLVAGIECYKDCSNAWALYIQQSLLPLISTGKGRPTQKETSASRITN